jgi:hypothetical protein
MIKKDKTVATKAKRKTKARPNPCDSVTKIVGIDPGVNGGIAYINLESGEYEAIKMPTRLVRGYEINKGILKPTQRTSIDTSVILSFLQRTLPDVIFMELVNPRPTDGKDAVMSSGVNKGGVTAAIEMLNIPTVVVFSQTWQSLVFNRTKRGDRDELKQEAIAYTKLHYPLVDLQPGLCRTDQDGISDAMCIAEFGRKWCSK